MRFGPRFVSLALPLLVLTNVAARADEIQVGTGLVCDTRQQAERFIALYEGNAQKAVRSVNAEVQDETACGIIDMAYTAGAPLTTARHKDATFQIVPVLMVGVVTEDGIQRVKPVPFFSIVAIDEREA
jgi:hypothetical protein